MAMDLLINIANPSATEKQSNGLDSCEQCKSKVLELPVQQTTENRAEMTAGPVEQNEIHSGSGQS